eukprot:4289296-Prymnesium_polylepis.1
MKVTTGCRPGGIGVAPRPLVSDSSEASSIAHRPPPRAPPARPCLRLHRCLLEATASSSCTGWTDHVAVCISQTA